MELFSTKQQPESETAQTVKPTVVRTENVAKELMHLASLSKVPVATLDFIILDVQTLVREAHEGKEVEWEELSSDEVANLNNKETMLDPKFQLRQVYEIEIFTKTESEPLDSMELSVGANASLTKVYLTIKPGSSVEYFEGFEAEFVKLVNKKKLRANLMISLFDEPMKDAVKTLVARIRVNQSITFEAKEMLLIAEGVEPVKTINDEVILHYEKKNEDPSGESDRVDHARRGYLISVVQDELLIEYIKPKEGQPGRNCRGEYLKPPEPRAENAPAFTTSDKIKVIDSTDTIEYHAKQSGYVTFENNLYDISTEMDVAEISFKTTGSIDTQLDADVSINVKESDVFKDAIGMGMEVEVNEINVDGNMGSNSTIRAKKATIEGQTHQSSKIYADKLKINIHKGTAVGKEVHVTRLEHGVVEGEIVRIGQAIGGKIKAKEIYVEVLGAHVTMTASDKIEVEKLVGEENHFIIDPVVLSASKAELSAQEGNIKEAKRHIVEVKREIEKYKNMIKENSSAFADLKKRLLNYKKNGVKMPTTFVKKYQQFQQMQAHRESLESELKQKDERLNMLTYRHNALQSDIFSARVICRGRWKGHNEITFRLIEPEIEVSLVPSGREGEHAFALVEDKEEESFSIVAVEQ